MKYKRTIKPSKVLPPSYIKGYYSKDAQTLIDVEKWLDKNGLTILFTLGEAYGDERVYLGVDGHIYIGTGKLPKKDWLKKLLLRESTELLQQAIKENWTRKKMYEELKKRSYKP